MKTQKLVSILKNIVNKGRSAGAAVGEASRKSMDWVTNRRGFITNNFVRSTGKNSAAVPHFPFSVTHPYITAAGRVGATSAAAGGIGGFGYGMAQNTGNWYNRLGKNLDTNSVLYSGAGATLGGLGSYALTEDPLLTGVGAGVGAAAGYAFANPQLIKDAVKSLKKLIKM